MSTQSLPQRWEPDSVLGKLAVAPCHLALLLTKAGDIESNPKHTNKHTPVICICDLCHKQINKKQTSIRCYHKHNTHWVCLKCTQIKQRQYTRDWRYSPSQPNYHPLTNNNQPKNKNIVILQININGIRNKIEELKKPRAQHPTGHHNTKN